MIKWCRNETANVNFRMYHDERNTVYALGFQAGVVRRQNLVGYEIQNVFTQKTRTIPYEKNCHSIF